MDAPDEIIQLKARLLGVSPMIWRRVLVPSSTTLCELHSIIQVAMGWEGIHLFLFNVRAVRCGSFELHAASSDISLQQFGLRENERLSYVYDMGDHWDHEVRVEVISDATLNKPYPASIGNSGGCPPEDCGDAPGYHERRDEADGYDTWKDMGVMVDFLEDVVAAGAPTDRYLIPCPTMWKV